MQKQPMEEQQSFTSLLLSFTLLLLLSHQHFPLPAAHAQEPLTPAFFIFGDSLIDDGNNNLMVTTARANYYPYGIDFSAGPTGRFCNGLTVVDYGAQYLGLPFIPPYFSLASITSNVLRGVNYASAAAGIIDDTGRHFGQRTTLNGQISQFETTVKIQLPRLFQSQNQLAQHLVKSVFLINIGGNDYLNNYLQPHRYDSSRIYTGEAFAELLINTLSGQLSRLYKLGARKIVLVGSGPLGCIPSFLSNTGGEGCVVEINNLIMEFNTRLRQLASSLPSSLPGSTFIYQDIYYRFSDMVANPEKYGFTVADRACCGNGRNGGELTCLPLQLPCPNRNQYIFWDSYHPTQAANAIIARSSYSPEATDCVPMSIYELAQL